MRIKTLYKEFKAKQLALYTLYPVHSSSKNSVFADNGVP